MVRPVVPYSIPSNDLMGGKLLLSTHRCDHALSFIHAAGERDHALSFINTDMRG
jgi:hypothetical protein